MNNLIINHNIPKKAEGTYYTIPFRVPNGNIDRITVSYSYDRFSGKLGKVNIVDLGLMDAEKRFLGWSGSAKSTIFVGPYAATSGYLMTDITPGEWHILLGAYKIPEGGLPVHYEITFTPMHPRWFVGDLHMHSTASDGRHDIYTLSKMAKKEGLDFIAVSNHNNYSENLHLPLVPGISFIPAVEWTHYRGHMNFFGVEAPFENSFVANSEQEMLTLVAKAKEKGALVSVNHPKDNLCPYLWQSDDCFDLVEVWNGPMRKANISGIAWWHNMLQDGRKIPLVGGSDFHRSGHIVRFAHPVNHVYASSPSTSDILNALSQGHNYVSASVKGVQLELKCGEYMMGDTITNQEDQTLTVKARRLRPGMQLKLINQDGVVTEWHRFQNGKLEAEVPVSKAWRFAYLLVSRNIFGMEYVRAISNPVYFYKEL
jgi:hypothetical protein